MDLSKYFSCDRSAEPVVSPPEDIYPPDRYSQMGSLLQMYAAAAAEV